MSINPMPFVEQRGLRAVSVLSNTPGFSALLELENPGVFDKDEEGSDCTPVFCCKESAGHYDGVVNGHGATGGDGGNGANGANGGDHS